MQLIQGTKEWALWRHQGLGASDAGVIMGIDPYKTPLELWKEKLLPEPPDGWDMRHAGTMGHDAEDKARAAYEFEQGGEFKPICIEHEHFPFLRASLDAYNEELIKGAEIKLVGKDKFEAGLVLPHHMAQMQDQMMLTGHEDWDYILCWEDQGVLHRKVITVEADQAYQADLLEKMIAFWGMVQNRVQPPYHERDWVPVENEELAALLDCLKAIKDSKAKADVAQAKDWRIQIAALCKYHRTVCDGAKITWKGERGSEKLTITFPKEGSSEK